MDDADDPRLIVTCPHPHGATVIASAGFETESQLPTIPGSLTAKTLSELPVMLFKSAVGTTKSARFQLPFEPASIKSAWLELHADDIDEPREAKIASNGTEITVTGEVLILMGTVRGRLVIPATALRRGENKVSFTFADNLGDSTEGYNILDASLVIVVK